jgi:hypothetical protein
MTRLLYVFLGLVVFGSSSCKKKENAQSTALIELRKTVCYGTCPIYQMTINGSGEMTFNGERFTDKIGNFTKTLNEEETKSIFTTLESFQWLQFKDRYPAQVSDLPSTIIHFRYKDIDKTIVIIGEHPAILDVIDDKLSNMANSDGWTDLSSQ